MAYTGKSGSLKVVDGGGNQDFPYRGRAQFNGTATSLELPVPLSRIRPGSLLQALPGTAAPTSLESIWIAEAPNATTGEIHVDDDGEITIARKVEGGGTVTTDLTFYFCIQGASKTY